MGNQHPNESLSLVMNCPWYTFRQHVYLVVRSSNFVHVQDVLIVATFRAARLTVQTRKLWLVSVATDRDAPLACPNAKNLVKKRK